ncbi:hypothetical protein [Mycobacteroides abscessus]|uniref:hypothetical protein n=1 Tax=Mycobacteroides abscessus TaxID=36809 RepID=UPI0010424278|nr:hypothetical protein [Mycobacteroides abscessus]
MTDKAAALANLNKQARVVNAFIARMAGIDAQIAAEAARRADIAAEEAHIRADDACRAAQEAKQRLSELVDSGVSNS